MSVSFPPAAGLTDVGIQRQNNEDTWIGPPSNLAAEVAAAKGYLYLVADGVGGHQGGEVASQIAAEVTRQVYYQDANPDVSTSLRAAIEEANRRIYHQAISIPSEYGMSTTITAAVVRGNELFVANVGDSRAYLIRTGQARQLTTDHTLVEEQRQAGLLTDEEAANHPRRNVITRSLGGELRVAVEVFPPTELAPGDQVLLCTDGLSDLLNDQEIARLVTQNRSPSAAVRQLVDLVRKRGAPDNVTAVVVGAAKARKRPVSAPPSRLSNLVALAVTMGVVLLVGAGILGLSSSGWLTRSRRDQAASLEATPTAGETLPAEPAVPAATPTLPPVSLFDPDNGATFTEQEQVELVWGWAEPFTGTQRFVIEIQGPGGVTSGTVGLERETKYVFLGNDERLEPGLYQWHVHVEKMDKGKWEILPGTQSEVRTFTVEASEPPKPPLTWTPPAETPTSAPQIVTPEPQAPGNGSVHGNPVTFRWSGSLAPGQAYEVTARHDETDHRVKSDLLDEREWTVDLPADKFGGWHWTISVVQAGNVLAPSEEWMFWFQPVDTGGGGGGGDDDGQGPPPKHD